MGPTSDMRFVKFLTICDCLVLRPPWIDFKFQTRVWKPCFSVFSSLVFWGWNLSKISQNPRKISEQYRHTKKLQSHVRTTHAIIWAAFCISSLPLYRRCSSFTDATPISSSVFASNRFWSQVYQNPSNPYCVGSSVESKSLKFEKRLSSKLFWYFSF